MFTRLRTQYLLFFALAAILPVLVLGLVEVQMYERSLPQREQEVLQEQQQYADLFANNLRFTLAKVTDPLQALPAIQTLAITQSSARRQVFVVDGEGRTLSHPNLVLVQRHQDLKKLSPVRAVVQGQRGTMNFIETLGGEDTLQLAAFTPVQGWGVVVVSLRSELLPGPFSNIRGFGLSLLLTALAAIGFAYWISERISQPLQNLSVQMQNLAFNEGPNPPEMPVGIFPLEVQVLIDSFRIMAERISAETAENRELLSNITAENDKLELIFNAIADGVLVYRRAGQITTANPAFWKLIDREPDELDDWHTLPLRDILGEVIAPEATVLAKAIAGGPLTGLHRLKDENGRVRVLQFTAAPLRKGEALGGVAVLRDVTAQKENERLREDFVATLTHDLRTPLLAAVQTLNFALGEHYGPINEQQQQILVAVVESHTELLGLVDSLLTIYRYEAGQMRLRQEFTEVVGFAEQCLLELQPLAEARNLHLSLHADGSELPKVAFDRQQLRRVVINLVDNALKFTPAGGKVEVNIVPNFRGIRFSVRDTGRGIPADRLVQIFSRFAQGSSYGGGSGLGLYLCRQVVEAHGGKIWAESKPQQGSAFHFTLPMGGKT
jgi:PAS domain S-box-containing protein